MTSAAESQVLVAARDHYMAKDIPLGGAIALPSVLYYESRLSPESQGYQPSERGGILNPHGAFGIASWNGPRQKNLMDFATKHNLPVDALDTQLDFVLNEMANGYPSSWAAVRSAASYKSIIPIIVDEYENPKDKPKEINGALVIAASLAALPLQPAPQEPIPQTPVPPVPPVTLPVPTAPAGRPPVTSTSAGRIAAGTDTIHAMREDRIAELIADDPEIAAYDAALAAFGKLEAVIIPAVVIKPLPSLVSGSSTSPNSSSTTTTPQRSPSVFGLSINWKTSLSGVLAAAFQGVSVAYPQYAPIFQILSSVAMAALGLSAKDAGVTGGTKSGITGNTGAPVSLIDTEMHR